MSTRGWNRHKEVGSCRWLEQNITAETLKIIVPLIDRCSSFLPQLIDCGLGENTQKNTWGELDEYSQLNRNGKKKHALHYNRWRVRSTITITVLTAKYLGESSWARSLSPTLESTSGTSGNHVVTESRECTFFWGTSWCQLEAKCYDMIMIDPRFQVIDVIKCSRGIWLEK